jgi:hypothetical protein
MVWEYFSAYFSADWGEETMGEAKRRRARMATGEPEEWAMTKWGPMRRIPGDPPDIIRILVGHAASLTPKDAEGAALSFLMCGALYPDAVLNPFVDGFDDDVREVWDIPAARDHLARFMWEILRREPSWGFADLNIDDPGGLFVCMGIGRVVGRSSTGNYRIAMENDMPKARRLLEARFSGEPADM